MPSRHEVPHLSDEQYRELLDDYLREKRDHEWILAATFLGAWMLGVIRLGLHFLGWSLE